MYENNKYSMTISIQLENGVYVFNKQPATGKTRLAKELRDIQAYDGDVSSYTYNDKLLGRAISDCFDSRFKVILLDRYDMYNGYGAELIEKYADSSIILLDCKDVDGPKIGCDYDICFIDMTSSHIEVEL
ncbi:MAG: hypothetical protein Q4F28_05580 [Eubacteriales bacterium]|nr:hypothetical protein [Eubacteriales bacterium]